MSTGIKYKLELFIHITRGFRMLITHEIAEAIVYQWQYPYLFDVISIHLHPSGHKIWNKSPTLGLTVNKNYDWRRRQAVWYNACFVTNQLSQTSEINLKVPIHFNGEKHSHIYLSNFYIYILSIAIISALLCLFCVFFVFLNFI